MNYQLIITDIRLWQKDCGSMTSKDLHRILERVELLKTQPWIPGLDIKKLQHYDGADYRLRVGDYRILFNKEDDQKTIYLLRILHRSKLY